MFCRSGKIEKKCETLFVFRYLKSGYGISVWKFRFMSSEWFSHIIGRGSCSGLSLLIVVGVNLSSRTASKIGILWESAARPKCFYCATRVEFHHPECSWEEEHASPSQNSINGENWLVDLEQSVDPNLGNRGVAIFEYQRNIEVLLFTSGRC